VSFTHKTLGMLGALTALALTGCGALQPGAAVEVGDETISRERVDEVAADFCTAVEPQLESQAETIPHGFFRSGIAGTLALRSVADQVAADYGVEPDSDQYLQTMADLQQGVRDLPEELRDSVLEVESAPPYVEAVQAAVGEVVLDGEGEYEDFVSAGADEFETWIAENGVEFDPAFDTTIKDGVPDAADGSLSFAVSEMAINGQAAEPNSMTARQLPASQRCGR
jgi:hypothetical protein